MPIKTFRGLLGNGAQERIRLETIDGKTGYRIKKFQIMPEQSNNNYEITAKIFALEQTAITSAVNFSEQTLIGAAFMGLASGAYAGAQTIIYDSMVFSQDIFITAKDDSGSQSCNFYIELEQIRLDDVEATAVILKNFRNTNDQ